MYTYKLYLKGNPYPIVFKTDVPVLSRDQADAILRQTEGTFYTYGPDGSHTTIRVSEIQAIISMGNGGAA